MLNRAAVEKPESASTRSPQMREVIGELDELRVVDRLEHLGHRGIVASARAALVITQRLQKIVLALVGEPRHFVPPRKVRAMVDVAVALLHYRPTAFETRRVAGIGRRSGRRLLGEESAVACRSLSLSSLAISDAC